MVDVESPLILNLTGDIDICLIRLCYGPDKSQQSFKVWSLKADECFQATGRRVSPLNEDGFLQIHHLVQDLFVMQHNQSQFDTEFLISRHRMHLQLNPCCLIFDEMICLKFVLLFPEKISVNSSLLENPITSQNTLIRDVSRDAIDPLPLLNMLLEPYQQLYKLCPIISICIRLVQPLVIPLCNLSKRRHCCRINFVVVGIHVGIKQSLFKHLSVDLGTGS